MNERRDFSPAIALLGMGVGATVLALWAASRKPEPPPGPPEPPPPAAEAIIQIEIRDAQGNIVPHNSPVDLYEGASYTFSYTVKNTSTRGGVPWGVQYTMLHQVSVYGVVLAQGQPAATFAAGQSITFGPFAFTIPWDTGGRTGAIDVLVKVPPAIIAAGSEPINVLPVAVQYGATIVIGV